MERELQQLVEDLNGERDLFLLKQLMLAPAKRSDTEGDDSFRDWAARDMKMLSGILADSPAGTRPPKYQHPPQLGRVGLPPIR